MSLRPLLEIAAEDARFDALAAAARGGSTEVHMSAAIRPFLLAALVSSDEGLAGRPSLIVAPDDIAARDLARDMRAYLAPRRVRYYPSRGTGYASHVAPPPHLVGLRIAALDSLAEKEGAVVVASAVALAEAVPETSLRPAGFTLYKGQEVDLSDVGDRLVEAGDERIDQVEERGQFAIRGGILDVFGATEDRAARLELFGDEIDQIRWFSTFTQRSLGDADALELAPAAELGAEHRELAEMALSEAEEDRPDMAELLPLDDFRAPLELIPQETAVLIASAGEMEAALRDQWEDVTAAMHSDDARRLYVDVADALDHRASVRISDSDSGQEVSFRAQAPSSAARNINEAEKQLERELRSGYRVVVAFEHRGEGERARYNLKRVEAGFLDGATPPTDSALLFAEAALSDGFISPDLKLAVIPFRRLVHRRRAAAPPSARGRLAAFTDLRVGDHVVHEDHGIARFAGFETKTVASVTRDYLELDYRGDDRVFAPTDQLAKITRYVGTGGEPPQLSALGSKRWEGLKSRARRGASAAAAGQVHTSAGEGS